MIRYKKREQITIRRFPIIKEKLKEKGRTHYFYHSPSSTLPIRDVLNELGEGHKTEPHIESYSENFVGPCRPTNIVAHLNQEDEKYLFLTTKCQNKQMVEYGEIYIVGYIEKSEHLLINEERHAVRGKTVIFPFEKAIPYYEIFSRFAPVKLVDKNKTRDILRRFAKAGLNEKELTCFLQRCVDEIDALDRMNDDQQKTCIVLRGGKCDYQSTSCLRWKNNHEDNTKSQRI